MSSDILQAFAYQGKEVRTVVKDGETYFLLADIRDALALHNSNSVVSRIRADKGVAIHYPLATAGGMQDAIWISEAGLYKLAFQSKVPGAEQFTNWVTSEVLPSIRQRGGYLTPEATEKALTDPDFIIQLATSLKEERAKALELQAKVVADAPKVNYIDTYVADDDLRILRDVAKSLGVKESWLRSQLLRHGWIYSQESSRWSGRENCKIKQTRYSAYAAKARYFRAVPNHEAPRFRGELDHTLKVTPAGAEAISRAVAKWQGKGEVA